MLITFSGIKKWRSPSSFLRYEQLKPKYGVFLQGFPYATVTFYVTKMTESFDVYHGTITLLLCDSVVVSVLQYKNVSSSVESLVLSILVRVEITRFLITTARSRYFPYFPQ